MKHFSLPKDGGLIEAGLPKDILHGYDKVYTELFSDPYHASEEVARELISEVNAFVPSEGKPLFKLGLTTGSTPQLLYQMLSDA